MAEALIVYTSLTGNTQECADHLADALEAEGIDVTIEEVFDVDPEDYLDYDLCICGCYSYGGRGELPYEIMDFYEELPEIDLTGKIYGVFGSGDTFYPVYCGAVDDFDEAFAAAGATKGGDGVKVNLNPEEEDIANLQALAKSLAQAVNS